MVYTEITIVKFIILGTKLPLTQTSIVVCDSLISLHLATAHLKVYPMQSTSNTKFKILQVVIKTKQRDAVHLLTMVLAEYSSTYLATLCLPVTYKM